MFNITLLGNSALLPLPGRAETAAFLECTGHGILFDCGEGTQCAARAAHVNLMKADVIALTHYHGDHVFGLPGLLQTMTILNRTTPLTIVGPGDIEAALRPIMALVGGTSYEIRLTTLPEAGMRLCDIAAGWPEKAYLTAFPTNHRVESRGYVVTLDRAGKFMPERATALGVPKPLWGRLQRGETVQAGDMSVTPEMVLGPARKGLKFVFSGDTMPCESLTRAAREADLFICEATYGEDEQAALAAEHGHMNFAQAARTGAEANVRRLWLTHFSQMIEDPDAYLPNAQAICPQTECGTDGKNIVLEFEK